MSPIKIGKRKTTHSSNCKTRAKVANNIRRQLTLFVEQKDAPRQFKT